MENVKKKCYFFSFFTGAYNAAKLKINAPKAFSAPQSPRQHNKP